jgi:AcrR family transcriptional regulator
VPGCAGSAASPLREARWIVGRLRWLTTGSGAQDGLRDAEGTLEAKAQALDRGRLSDHPVRWQVANASRRCWDTIETIGDAGNGVRSRYESRSATQEPAEMRVKGRHDLPTTPRRRNAERTRAEILTAAIKEFSERGLNGARVDRIAARTRTNKRMIYYYFKSKRQLFMAVLEDAYRRIREAERQLHLDDLPPLVAMQRLVEFTCDYHWKNPEFAKLVAIENVQKGRNITRVTSITGLNTSIIDATGKVLRRGSDEGVFRDGIDPVKLHMTISALPLFHITNRYTFGTIFRHDMASAEALAARRREIVDIVLRYVSA